MQPQKETIRICLLISTFYPFVGGGETHALSICRKLIRIGRKISVVTRRNSKTLLKRDEVDAIPVYRVGPSGFRRLGKYLMIIPVFVKLLALRNRYDVILVSGLRLLSIPGIIAAKLLGKKCVLRAASCGELSGAFIWDSPHLQGKNIRVEFYKFLIGIRNRLFLKADGFLAISHAIEEEYLNCAVPASKIATINNGTDTDRFKPVAYPEKKILRNKLGLPPDNIFTYSGKLNKGKGLQFLLRIWRYFHARHPETHLLLVGSGKNHFLSCEQELKDYVAGNNLEESVTFTGYVENVDEYLQLSNFFIFPSENESLSNALIEALACGLPCIASDVGGIPDTVKDGVNGFLLPKGDESAWINAMEKLVSNPTLARQMSSNGRNRILERNSIKTVANKYLYFLQSV